jgi:hypothetical protein
MYPVAAKTAAHEVGDATLGHGDGRREAGGHQPQDQLAVGLEREPRRAVVSGDVRGPGPSRHRPGDQMRALVMADHDVRLPACELEHLAHGRQVQAGSHAGAADGDAPRADVFEQLPLLFQRDQPGREAALREPGQEDRPVALGAAHTQVPGDEQGSDHPPTPRRRPARNTGAVASWKQRSRGARGRGNASRRWGQRRVSRPAACARRSIQPQDSRSPRTWCVTAAPGS